MGCYVGSLTENPVVLVRVFGPMTELFLDREKEMEMFRVLHKYACGPRLYCSFTNGICYEFVRGVVLDDILLKRPSVYRSANTQLSHTVMHVNCTIIRDFSFLEFYIPPLTFKSILYK